MQKLLILIISALLTTAPLQAIPQMLKAVVGASHQGGGGSLTFSQANGISILSSQSTFSFSYIPYSAGTDFFVAVSWCGSACGSNPTVTMSDTFNGAYTATSCGAVLDPSGAANIEVFHVKNTVSISTSITATFSLAVTGAAMELVEYSNANATSPVGSCVSGSDFNRDSADINTSSISVSAGDMIAVFTNQYNSPSFTVGVTNAPGTVIPTNGTQSGSAPAAQLMVSTQTAGLTSPYTGATGNNVGSSAYGQSVAVQIKH